MNRVDRNFLFTSILIFLILHLPLQLGAQAQSQYEGNYEIGSYSGKAKYQYYLSGTDTILDGDFQMQRSSLEALLKEEDASFFFKGRFEKGVAVGPWKFQFGEYQSDNESKVVDFEYRVLISGVQEEGNGSIKNGSPDGKWTYQVNQIKDSEIDKTLFKSEFTFENGVPQQNFKIENHSSVLVGRFLRNGLAHDEWSSYSLDVIEDTESWFFEDGLLLRIKNVRDGIPKTLSVFEKDEIEYRTIPFSQKYIMLLEATLSTRGDSLDLTKGISGLFSQNETYYGKLSTILSQLGSTTFQPKYRVKVPFYELDSVQKVTLDDIAHNFETASAISENLLGNSHFNIIKRSDPEALYHYNVVSTITTDFVRPLVEFVKYRHQGIIEYIDVQQLLKTLWPNGKPGTSLTITDGLPSTRTFELANAGEFNFEDNNLSAISQLIAYAKLSLERVKDSLADQLTNEEKLQDLNRLEEELIALNDSLVLKVDSLKKLPKTYQKALEQISSLGDSSLEKYAMIENSNEKLAYGNNLKTCLMQLLTLADTLGALPEEQEKIATLYQDSVWNPFMATVMDEEVKKRITASYSKILLPYFIEKVATAIDCESADLVNQQILRTNQRMEDLREEDTRKLERKLKREKNPEEILKLLVAAAIEKED